jgi:hypothetical protein
MTFNPLCLFALTFLLVHSPELTDLLTNEFESRKEDLIPKAFITLTYN